MAGKYDIYIIEAGGEYRVRPAVAMVEGSGGGGVKPLKIRNVTGYTTILAFPPNFIVQQDIVTIGSKGTATVNLVQGLDGNYPYSVVVCKNGELLPAKGESGPSVIVDP